MGSRLLSQRLELAYPPEPSSGGWGGANLPTPNRKRDYGNDDPALSIQKREIVEICLSWGGPADYIEIHLTGGEVDKVLYRFSNGIDTATLEIEKDSPLYTYAMFSLEMMSQ